MTFGRTLIGPLLKYPDVYIYIYIYIYINPKISIPNFISAHSSLCLSSLQLTNTTLTNHNLTHSQMTISPTLNLTFGQLPNLSPPVQVLPPSQAFATVPTPKLCQCHRFTASGYFLLSGSVPEVRNQGFSST